MSPFRMILVPLDGSTFAEQALPLAMRLAEKCPAMLHLSLVHIPVPGWYSAAEVVVLSPALEQEARDREELYLAGAASRVKEKSAVPVTTSRLDGGVAAALADQVAKTGADVVIMTTHGRGGLSRLWLGSVTDRLIRRLMVPVLVVRPTESGIRTDPPLKRILVPLDGSALAETVLPSVRALASAAGAELVLAMVVEPVPTLLPLFPHPLAIESDDIDQREAEARVYLKRIKDDLQATGFNVISRIVMAGDPVTQIMRLADAEHCDIIALAKIGRAHV